MAASTQKLLLRGSCTGRRAAANDDARRGLAGAIARRLARRRAARAPPASRRRPYRRHHATPTATAPAARLVTVSDLPKLVCSNKPYIDGAWGWMFISSVGMFGGAAGRERPAARGEGPTAAGTVSARTLCRRRRSRPLPSPVPAALDTAARFFPHRRLTTETTSEGTVPGNCVTGLGRSS